MLVGIGIRGTRSRAVGGADFYPSRVGDRSVVGCLTEKRFRRAKEKNNVKRGLSCRELWGDNTQRK